ncbi:MAG: hypothetical protein IMX00_00105 [Limnochordales bacterium]|nr:hypothetical protein [Limnochordales bacterium]
MDLLRMRAGRRRWRPLHRRSNWDWRGRDQGRHEAEGRGEAAMAKRRTPSRATGPIATRPGAVHRSAAVRLRATILTLMVLAVAAALLVALGSYRDYPVAAVVPPELEQQENAIWLGYRWFSGAFSDAELLKLVERVRQHRFGYLLLNAGSLDAGGRLAQTRGEGLVKLLDALHGAGYEGKVLAWLNGKNAEYGPGVDLEDPEIRRAITATVRELMVANSVDGIQLDIKSIRSGDPFFLALLDEIRTNGLLPGQILSVAVRPLRSGWNGGWLRSDLATPDYLQEVAGRVDQLAVLTYDSALPLPGLYQRWLESQVESVVNVAIAEVRRREEKYDSRDFSLLFAVPSFDDPRFTHWPVAENVVAASQALVAAFARCRERGELPLQLKMGYSLYAEWTTDETEWQALGHLWS